MANSKSGKKDERFQFQYAAKVICTSDIPGTSQTSASVLPGNYETAVNIHNPHHKPVRYRKKVAVPGRVTDYLFDDLPPDGVSRVVCREMVQDFGITFIHGVEGYLVIESTHSLDVTAVYTAGKTGGGVESIDVKAVTERSL